MISQRFSLDSNALIRKQLTPDPPKRMGHQISGMRKLAAQVITLAIHDYLTATQKLEQARFSQGFVSHVKFQEYKQHQRLEKKYAYRFLTSESIWHEILDLKPVYIKRKLDSRDFKLFEALTLTRNQYGGVR